MTNYMSINDSGDTTTDDRLQYKVYVDGSVMWGFEAAPDSTEWFQETRPVTMLFHGTQASKNLAVPSNLWNGKDGDDLVFFLGTCLHLFTPMTQTFMLD